MNKVSKHLPKEKDNKRVIMSLETELFIIKMKAKSLEIIITSQDYLVDSNEQRIKIDEINDKKNISVDELNFNYRETINSNTKMYVNQALLVLIYSFLEYELNSICEYLQEKKEYKIGYEDIKGNGIGRVRTYLELVHSIDMKSMNSLWSDIQAINKIRNCIVHVHGSVDTCIEKRFSIEFQKISGVHIAQGKVEIEKEYLLTSIKNISDLLLRIFELGYNS